MEEEKARRNEFLFNLLNEEKVLKGGLEIFKKEQNSSGKLTQDDKTDKTDKKINGSSPIQSTLLSHETVEGLVRIGGTAIHHFLRELARWVGQASIFTERGIVQIVERARELQTPPAYLNKLTTEEQNKLYDVLTGRTEAVAMDAGKVAKAKEIIGTDRSVILPQVGTIQVGQMTEPMKVYFIEMRGRAPPDQVNATIAEGKVYVFARSQEEIHPQLLARILIHEAVEEHLKHSDHQFTPDQIHTLARKAEKVLGAIVLGGPDGVLLPASRTRKTTLETSPSRGAFLHALRAGYDVVIVTNQRWGDDEVTFEKGIRSRLVDYIPEHLRRNLTVYLSSGTIKITFDEQGREVLDHEFNVTNTMSAGAITLVEEKANAMIEKYWREYLANPVHFKNLYPSFVFRKPAIYQHKIENDVYGMSILYWPSRHAGVGALKEERDQRQEALEELVKSIREANPYFFDEYTVRTAGVTTIDLRKRDTGKDHAVRQYMVENNPRPEDVIFFGNLDIYAEDRPISNVRLNNAFINDPQRKNLYEEGFIHAGEGVASVARWLAKITGEASIQKAAAHIKQRSEEARHPALELALFEASKLRSNREFNELTRDAQIEKLWGIYQSHDLRFSKEAAWPMLYTAVYDGYNRALVEALEEVKAAFRRTQNVEEYFAEVDRIYEARQNDVNFFDFYAGTDPRAAKNLTFLRARVYTGHDSDERLRNDIKMAQDINGFSTARILIGYFQDAYVYARKVPGTSKVRARAPPGVTYVGGGGKATTHLMRDLVLRGIDNIATIVSSSDDGGSSEKIMMAFLNTFGSFFIPPGDAAGMMIWMSADNARIYMLFESETMKELPAEIKARGRISGTALLPVWRNRVEETAQVVEGKVEIPMEVRKPKDFVMLISGLLTLGEMLDRELISTDIIKLENMSTANMILIGAAYDAGAIRHDHPMQEVSFENLASLLGLKGQKVVPVSFDYERSALVATNEAGEPIVTQTIITDKGHTSFIKDLKLVHRVGSGKTLEDVKELEQLPKVNQEAVEAIRNTKGAIVMGNGSLFTSFLPNLLYREVVEEIMVAMNRGIKSVYIAKIKADLETAKNVKAVEHAGKYYLEIGDQLDLIQQLEIIRAHVSKVLGRKVRLNEIMSHVILPKISEEAYLEMKVIEMDSTKAQELNEALAKGKAQVSKYVEGVQKFSPEDVRRYEVYLQEQGIEVVAIAQEHINGISKKAPVYKNEELIKVIEENIIGRSLAQIREEALREGNNGTTSASPLEDHFNALGRVEGDTKVVRVSYERAGENFRQVSDIEVPAYDVTNTASVEEAARRLAVEVYNRLTIFGAVKVKVAAEEALFARFYEIFMNPALSSLPQGKGYGVLGSFMNVVYQTNEFGIDRVDEGGLEEVESTRIRTIESVNTQGAWLGLDIGGSDIKAVIVKDGQLIHHKIVKWSPKTMTDPYAENGHIPAIKGILNEVVAEAVAEGFNSNELKAIGVSINLAVANNKVTGLGPVVESLRSEQAKVMSQLDVILNQEFNLPVYVLNDGDAAAIQTTIDMGLPNTVSLAGGTGLAMGYGSTQFLTEGGNIVIDTNNEAVGHSFSKVAGAAQQYISQRPVFRLAELAGIDLSMHEREADKLVKMQKLYEARDERAVEVFKQMPKYLVEFINIVARILKVENVVLFGRITKGEAGEFLKEESQRQLDAQGVHVNVHFPRAPEGIDQEVYLEVGQAVGATYYAAYKFGSRNQITTPSTSSPIQMIEKAYGDFEVVIVPMFAGEFRLNPIDPDTLGVFIVCVSGDQHEFMMALWFTRYDEWEKTQPKRKKAKVIVLVLSEAIEAAAQDVTESGVQGSGSRVQEKVVATMNAPVGSVFVASSSPVYDENDLVWVEWKARQKTEITISLKEANAVANIQLQMEVHANDFIVELPSVPTKVPFVPGLPLIPGDLPPQGMTSVSSELFNNSTIHPIPPANIPPGVFVSGSMLVTGYHSDRLFSKNRGGYKWTIARAPPRTGTTAVEMLFVKMSGSRGVPGVRGAFGSQGSGSRAVVSSPITIAFGGP
ncbi:MAG: YvcK family protein, partial [Candidatus Omnitrophica bacterium]|nr:YvcK family protein [Candidatus Omnitrophota bacterium]